ncbi:InlB B-repeat-containing protein [uncultured Anaerococcus sp.]|uniref:InlB B-repeat-containing protein n=1 Tax=uncultured Anaerococcus sp. TaxID=293428 RepID=UPI002889A74E|nr:InlB B-repeat-containing protein [uncultured Anaerococcus sp.]
MKKYIKAKELLESNANKKEKKPIYATRKLSIGLVSCMLGLVMATPVVNAEEGNQNQPQQVQEENQPADNEVEDPDTNHAPVPLENDETPKDDLGSLETQGVGGLEFGPDLVGEPVKASVKAPTVNPVLYDATTISGANLAKVKVKDGKKYVTKIATVHVILKGKDGSVKANLEDTPKSGTKWSVSLPEGKKVEEGDTVTVYQQIGEDKSSEVTKDAQPSKASEVTLTMPTGEIWIEQTSSNQVNKDEQAEAVQMLKDANTAIASDIKSVEFSIDGINHAYYEVTYTDGSTSGKVEAKNLTITQVTDYSMNAKLNEITIVDNVIKGKLAGEGPFDGIKVQLILKLSDAVKGSYCDEGKCLVDKDTSNPVDAVVNSTTGEFTYTIPNPDLKLEQVVGVIVKEPHKFKSCSSTTVKPVKVEKQKVRDPRKLTGDDKKAIDAAIRKAYTVNGESKLPNGTGDWKGVPAVIQIDDSGNVKIFSGNDVTGTWDPNNDYKFVPEKNEDGSVKIKDGAEAKITIAAKDLLKNIKPEAPTLALSGDNITITPNLGENKDTDTKTINVSYKDKDGKDQTTTATKADDGTWSITKGEGSVDTNGVITLPKNKVKGESVVSATVTDKGGIADDDKDPLTSDPGTLTLEETKADKVEALGGLDPVTLKKWVGDEVDWKKGVKVKDDAKKDEVEELLKGAKFEDVTEEKRSTSKEGDFEGKIKVTFDDDSSIEVDKQMLYVSNHVTSTERKDKVPTDALDVEFKLGEGTKVDNTGSGAIEGNKDNPTSYSNYKVKPNTNLKEYKIPAINASAVDSIKLSAQDGYTDPTWNTNNFVATSKNKVFTATATKTYKVTVVPNGGTGTKIEVTKKKDETYTLPAANTFTPPNDNQEFSGWKIGDDTNLKQPNESIKISGDTEIKAIWKPIEFKVTFKTEAGAEGSMNPKTVTKGSEYKLPKPTFKAIEGKEFAGWKVGDSTELKPIGEKIDISGDVTLTATWKDIEYKVSFDGNTGTGSMDTATVKKGEKYKLPENTFGTPPDKQKFRIWEVDGKEVAPGTEITVEKDTVVKAIWKAKKTETPDPSKPDPEIPQPGKSDPSKPDPETPQPGKPDPEKPEKPGENPEKPGDKEPGKENDKNEEGKKPGVEDRLRIRYNPNGGHWNDNSTDIITYYYDRGNIITLINPPTREGYRFLYWKGSAYQPGDKYTVVDDHMFVAQWEKIGTKASRSNPKTGLESVAGIVCTLVGSTGALYISRKKED